MASIENHTVVNINTSEENNTIVARRQGDEPFPSLHRIEKAERTEEQKKIEEDWTKDMLDNLDDVIKVGLGFGTMVLLGISLTNFRSLDGKDQCDTGPEVVKTILTVAGLSLILLTSSVITAMCTKTVGKFLKNKNKERLNKRVLRFGTLLSFAIAAAGFILLVIYFSDMYVVRMGVKGCGGLSTTMTHSFWAWGVLGAAAIVLSFIHV